jgi:hypothetical protein
LKPYYEGKQGSIITVASLFQQQRHQDEKMTELPRALSKEQHKVEFLG